ncbi:MAG: radical SAM protein [Candidatus Wallbacteria bacterium]
MQFLQNANLSFKVNEIFKSIQGESTYAGLPCVFIRLTGCNLRCSYCDTRYAYDEGADMTICEIIKKIETLNAPIIELTGGEPLLQENIIFLINAVIDWQEENKHKFSGIAPKLLIETSGSISIKDINKKAVIIMDIKTPSSGMNERMLPDNINYLKHDDEIKFVIGSIEDYEYSKKIIFDKKLYEKSKILFSSVFGQIKPETIIELMLKDKVPARFQLQMHKYIWPPELRGV